MKEKKETLELFEKGFISADQFAAIASYRSQGLFSLRSEIRFLFFIAVSLFVSGAGILVYQDINSVGHVSLLSLLFILCSFCFFYAFKHAPGFSNEKQESKKSLFPYVVLAGNLLAGIFMGYLQYQYAVFGTHYNIATLVPTLLYFFSAYYFDHKGVLAIGITGLCAFIGFSASPSGLLYNDFSETWGLVYYAIALAFVFIVWADFAESGNFKKHFNETYYHFSLHILGVATLSQINDTYWPLAMALLAAAVFYFVRLAYKLKSAYFLVFAYIYGFFGLSSLFVKLFEFVNLMSLIIYLSPFYLMGVIYFLIKIIRHLKKHSQYDSL